MKVAWIQSHRLHLQWKFKLWAGKFASGAMAFVFKSLLTSPRAMFCLKTSSELSHKWFEFSLKVKVMGSNPDYLLNLFLLYQSKCIYVSWSDFHRPSSKEKKEKLFSSKGKTFRKRPHQQWGLQSIRLPCYIKNKD